MAKYYVHNLRAGARPAPAGYSSWLDYWDSARYWRGRMVYCPLVSSLQHPIWSKLLGRWTSSASKSKLSDHVVTTEYCYYVSDDSYSM